MIFTAAWIFVAVMAFRYGNTDWILHGVDYKGNVCGKESANTPTEVDLLTVNYGSIWTNRTYIWYPIDYDIIASSSDVTATLQQILKLGVCVDACPEPNGALINPTKVQLYNETELKEWNVWYASTEPILNRCVPNITSDKNHPLVQDLITSFLAETGIGSVFSYLEAELFDAVWVLLIGIGSCVVLCFVWIVFLKFTVTFFVYLVLLIVVAMLTSGSVLLFWRAEYVKWNAAQDDPWRDYILVMQISGGVLGAFAVIFLLLVVFMWKRIQIAIQILKLAAAVITTTPSIVIVPLICVVFIIADVVYAVFIGITLHSAGQVVPDNITIHAPWLVDALNKTNELVNSGLTLTNLSNSSLNLTVNATTTFDTLAFQEQFPFELKTAFQLFNLFEFLWFMGLINAIAFMTMGFVTVMYYFSTPGDGKSAPVGAVFTGLWWTLRYHLGTVAMGSFIIAVIQMIRIIASYIQNKVEQSQNEAAKWIGRCIQCYLACLERIVTWINKNAYILCCIESTSFCSSAATAVGLLLANLADVSAANFISDALFIFCKICITGLNVGIMYLLLNVPALATPSGPLFFPLLLGGFISWSIASVFMHVYDAVQDTALMCYCYDKKHNDGNEKPYYFNARMQSILNKYNERRDHKGRTTRKVVPTMEFPAAE